MAPKRSVSVFADVSRTWGARVFFTEGRQPRPSVGVVGFAGFLETDELEAQRILKDAAANLPGFEVVNGASERLRVTPFRLDESGLDEAEDYAEVHASEGALVRLLTGPGDVIREWNAK